MQPISYARDRFPSEVIRHAVWLYLRFTLSYCDVEELLPERGLDVSCETVRCWVAKLAWPSRATASSHPMPSSTTPSLFNGSLHPAVLGHLRAAAADARTMATAA